MTQRDQAPNPSVFSDIGQEPGGDRLLAKRRRARA